MQVSPGFKHALEADVSRLRTRVCVTEWRERLAAQYRKDMS